MGGGLSFGVLMELIFVIAFSKANLPPSQFEKATEIGTVENIGMQLFTKFLFPFEVTSVLLLAAIVGAVVLAKKKLN